ncbi:MAG: NAD(P)H-dependent oxidoreductase [Pseudomonadota bacterium]
MEETEMAFEAKDKLQVAVIYGSDREGRLCDAIATWLLPELAKTLNAEIKVLDPLQLGLPARLLSSDTAEVTAFKALVDQSDCFVILTPEYNHSFPSAVKHLLDTAYVEWGRKPVAFVSYGGMAGGVRAVEQLRQVVAELSMVAVRNAVALPNPWNNLEDDVFHPTDQAAAAVDTMMTDLVWWASALKLPRQQAS